MNHTFEYVASGLSYFQILNLIIHDRPELQKTIADHFAKIDGYENHRFSFL